MAPIGGICIHIMSHSNVCLSGSNHVGTFAYFLLLSQTEKFKSLQQTDFHICIESSIEVKYYFSLRQIFNLNIYQIAQRRLAEIRDVRGSLAGIPIIVVSMS